MVTRQLRAGLTYYWAAPARDVKAGYDISSRNLGLDYAIAYTRANDLNERLARWRRGELEPEVVVDETIPGTIGWMFGRYYESDAFTRLKPRTQQAYRRVVKRTLKKKSKEGRELGEYRLQAVSPLAADRIYQRLLEGPNGTAVRVANFSISVIKRAWRVVGRQYRRHFPALNPWDDLEQRHKYKAKRAASRAEAYALAHALSEIGYPSLGLVALVCYEWHQRPENILSGSLKWSDWRPQDRPNHVRLEHAKTGEEVWLPLVIGGKDMFPEIEAYIKTVPRLGEAMVMTMGERRGPHLFSFDYANRRMREAREKAELAGYVTFDACRHGGMTELGDADVTEQGIMALSGHKTPDAARRYIKWTEHQRIVSLKKRRQVMTRAMQRIEKETQRARGGSPTMSDAKRPTQASEK